MGRCRACGEKYGEGVTVCPRDGAEVAAVASPPRGSTPVPPRGSTPVPPRGSTPVPPRASTLVPPRGSAPSPPRGSTPVPSRTRALGSSAPSPPPGAGGPQPGGAPQMDSWSEPTVASDAASGPRLLAGRYLLRRCIGEGGFGAVFEAEDTRLGKRVAVKLLAPHVASQPEAVQRFQREAVAASQIGHKGIVDVTDFDVDADGSYFIVMEYIEGTELGRLIQTEGPLAPARALAIAGQIAQALGAAHRKGILHRDLKPGNVFLTTVGAVEDFVKVLDFGISKILYFSGASTEAGDAGAASSGRLTATGTIMGTPHYMAPEQATGEGRIDGRVDVYALGGILYEMLVGRPPFDGPTPIAIITGHLFKPAPLPSAERPELPPSLDALVAKALAKKPAERHASMEELHAAIVDVLAEIDPAAAAAARRTKAPVTPMSATPVPGLKASSTPAPAERTSGLEATLAAPAPGSASASLWTPAPAPGPAAPAETAPAPRRRTALLGALAGVLVAGMVVAVVAQRGGKGARAPAPAPSPAPEAAGAAETSAPVAGAATAVGAPDPAPVAAPAAAPGPAQAPPAAGPTPEVVEIVLVLDPPDAVVELDGIVVKENPLRLPRSDRTRTLVVTAPGRKPERRELRVDVGGEVRIALARERARKERQRPPTKPGVGGLMEDDL